MPFGTFNADAFDTEQLLECVEKLKSGHSVQVPIYDFKTHQRCSDTFRQVLLYDICVKDYFDEVSMVTPVSDPRSSLSLSPCVLISSSPSHMHCHML